MRTLAMGFACAFAAAASSLSHATEGGTTSFPNGGEDFLVAAMPPPGFYAAFYATHYAADRLAGRSSDLPMDFNLRVNALTPRLDWVRNVSFLGADRWGTLVIVPWLDIDVALAPAAGVRLAGSRRGIGDAVIGNGLHWTFDRYEVVNAFDLVLPSGHYDAAAVANTGRDQYVTRLSHMGTWLPHPAWEVSYRVHWDHNFRNRDTDYRSGDTLYLNYAAGWKPAPQSTVGIAGYVLAQVTDDRGPGAPAGGNRLGVRGIGPAVAHVFPGGILASVKYFRETHARNGPRGQQASLHVAVPF